MVDCQFIIHGQLSFINPEKTVEALKALIFQEPHL